MEEKNNIRNHPRLQQLLSEESIRRET